tara:strand:+ start:472 stop:690 length:219 start_codon:yes stop_codon:yes gene_type:complete
MVLCLHLKLSNGQWINLPNPKGSLNNMFLIVGQPVAEAEAAVAAAEEDVVALEEATSTQIHMQDFLQKSLLS